MQRVKERLRQQIVHLYLGNNNEDLTLPCAFAYADDLSIVTTSLVDLNTIAEVLHDELPLYGLEVHDGKSKLVIKTTEQLGPWTIPVVMSVKFLGITVHSDVNRHSSIVPRCNTTVRTLKALMSCLKKLKAPIELLMRVYQVVIVPSLLYGVKTTSLTLAMRKTLVRRELLMLRDLVSVEAKQHSRLPLTPRTNNQPSSDSQPHPLLRIYSPTRSFPHSA